MKAEFPSMFEGILRAPRPRTSWPGPLGTWWRDRELMGEGRRILEAERRRLRHSFDAQVGRLGYLAVQHPQLTSDGRDHLAQAVAALKSAVDGAEAHIAEAEASLRAVPDPEPAVPIYELHLSSRAVNALQREDINTVGRLLSMPEDAIRRLHGVGEGTLSEIAAALIEGGFTS